jgi:DNA-binding transcriptional MerR regulator
VSSERDKLQKLYFRIGEVATIVGVEPHVLRYWEGEFRSVRPQKSARGQRIYSRRDVETLLKVKELLYAHRFTIAGARRRLREGGPDLDAPEPAGPAAEASAAPQAAQAAAVEAEVHAVPALVIDAPQVSAEPGVPLEELRAVHVRLCSLRDRARALLAEVDTWGDDDAAAP